MLVQGGLESASILPNPEKPNQLSESEHDQSGLSHKVQKRKKFNYIGDCSRFIWLVKQFLRFCEC